MIKKLAKWTFLTIATLLLLLISVYYYLVISFDTVNFPENHGKVHTKLFTGNEKNQPLIVGFGGSEGGNSWASDHWKPQRDKFISQGYAFLAVGYFNMQGIPKELDRISLNAIHKAITDATGNTSINANCIALIGGSKGAELSLVLASYYNDIKAVVAIVPGSSVFAGLTMAMSTSSFTFNNKQLPFVPVPWSVTPSLLIGDLRGAWEIMLKDTEAVANSAIKIENINGPIFLLSAIKDEMWPSTEMSEIMMDRLKQSQFPHHYEHIAIEGGHSAPLNHFDIIEAFLTKHFKDNNLNQCLNKQ